MNSGAGCHWKKLSLCHSWCPLLPVSKWYVSLVYIEWTHCGHSQGGFSQVCFRMCWDWEVLVKNKVKLFHPLQKQKGSWGILQTAVRALTQGVSCWWDRTFSSCVLTSRRFIMWPFKYTVSSCFKIFL